MWQSLVTTDQATSEIVRPEKKKETSAADCLSVCICLSFLYCHLSALVANKALSGLPARHNSCYGQPNEPKRSD